MQQTSSYKGKELSYIKVILAGDSKVGKTSFFIRAIKNITPQQPQSTIGVEYASKQIVYKGQLVTLKIWDTAGSEKYKSVTSNHFRQSQGALVFFDLTDLYTYENIQNWLKGTSKINQDIKNYADDSVAIVIVGNKLDLVNEAQNLRCISQEKVQQMCKDQNLLYTEISTKTGEGINELIEQLVKNLQTNKIENVEQQERQRQNCCH